MLSGGLLMAASTVLTVEYENSSLPLTFAVFHVAVSGVFYSSLTTNAVTMLELIKSFFVVVFSTTLLGTCAIVSVYLPALIVKEYGLKYYRRLFADFRTVVVNSTRFLLQSLS